MLVPISSLNRLALLAITFCWSVSLFAQSAQPKKVRFIDKSADERTEIIVSVMKTRLSLTPEQAPKVREIILAKEKQRDADFKANKGNKDALEEARKKRNAAEVVELRKILTVEQMKIFNKNRLEIRNEALKKAGVVVEE